MERAFIAENDARQVRALRRILWPDFQIVEARDTRSAREMLERGLDYALFLFDIHLEDEHEGGLVLFDEFHPVAPYRKFIILSADTRPRFVNYGLTRATFVAKPCAIAKLRAVAAEALMVRTADASTSRVATAFTSAWKLTLKEREVLACHLDGKDKAETCAALGGMNPRTHESHVRNILARAQRAGHSFHRLSALTKAIRSAHE